MARVERPPRGDAMDLFLAKKDLYRKPVAKDISSLFRVFSEAIYQVQIFHDQVKKRCISYLRDQAEEFLAEFDDRWDFESHVTDLETEVIRPGFPEVLALCRAYDVTLKLYTDVNAEPKIFNKLGRRPIMATTDAVHHFDLVFPIAYLGDVALCQSLVYDLLYRNVFGMAEEIEIGMKNLRTKSKRGCICGRVAADSASSDDFFPRRSSVSSSAGDQEFDREILETSDASSLRSAASPGTSDASTSPPPLPTSSPASLPSFMSSSPLQTPSPLDGALVCPRHSRNNRPVVPPMPFPFRVAKALDPEIYRNVEHDTWYESKKQEEIDATCEMFVKPFMVGDRCLVTLEDKRESSPFYHAHIQRIADAGPVLVFIEELGEKRELPVKNLRTLPTNQRSFTNRQFKHLRSLRFAPDSSADCTSVLVGSRPAPTVMAPPPLPPPPPTHFQGGRGRRFHDGRAASRGYSHFDRPILNACGKPRKDRFYGNPQFLQNPPRFVQPLRLNGFIQPGCVLPGGLRGASGSVMEPMMMMSSSAPPPPPPLNLTKVDPAGMVAESLAPIQPFPSHLAMNPGASASAETPPSGKVNFVIPPRFQSRKPNLDSEEVDALGGKNRGGRRFRSRSDSVCSADVEVKIEIPTPRGTSMADTDPALGANVFNCGPANPSGAAIALLNSAPTPISSLMPSIPASISLPVSCLATEAPMPNTPLFFPCAPMSPFDPPDSPASTLCIGPQFIPSPSPELMAHPGSSMCANVDPFNPGPLSLIFPTIPPPSPSPIQMSPAPEIVGPFVSDVFAMQMTPPFSATVTSVKPPLHLAFSSQSSLQAPLPQHQQRSSVLENRAMPLTNDGCHDPIKDRELTVEEDVGAQDDASATSVAKVETVEGDEKPCPPSSKASVIANEFDSLSVATKTVSSVVAFEQNASDDVKLSMVGVVDNANNAANKSNTDAPIESDAAIILAGKPESSPSTATALPVPVSVFSPPALHPDMPPPSNFPYPWSVYHPLMPYFADSFQSNTTVQQQQSCLSPMMSVFDHNALPRDGGGCFAGETVAALQMPIPSLMPPGCPLPPPTPSPSPGIPLMTPPPSPALPALFPCGSYPDVMPMPFGSDMTPAVNYVPMFYPTPSPSPAFINPSVPLTY